MYENIYQIIKVNGDGLKYGRFNRGRDMLCMRISCHEVKSIKINRYQTLIIFKVSNPIFRASVTLNPLEVSLLTQRLTIGNYFQLVCSQAHVRMNSFVYS